MGRRIERHRGGRAETREAIRTRAAAFTLLASTGGGDGVDGVLLGVAAEGAQQVAAHRRVRFNQEPAVENARAVAGSAVADALREHPALLTEIGRPPDDVIEALGGIAAYYQLLEEAADLPEGDL